MYRIPMLAALTILALATPGWSQSIMMPTPEQMELAMKRAAEAGAHVGPVVRVGGPVVTVENPALAPPTDLEFKIYIESSTLYSPDQPIELLEAAARFINMHVEAGVPLENINIAVVIHATATDGALGHEEYRARYGIDNPNIQMFEALSEVGVKFYVYDQSSIFFGLTKENKAEQVEIALSAMTVIAVLRSQGYGSVF